MNENDEEQIRVLAGVACDFTAYGDPKGQPRARAFAMGRGKVRMYDHGTAEHWKGQVALAAHDYLPSAPLEGPLMVRLTFMMKRPKAHFRSNGLLKDTAPLWHDKKPDADNAAKAVLDALTTLGMWGDDKQVAVLSILMRYTIDAERPGCRVCVGQLIGEG